MYSTRTLPSSPRYTRIANTSLGKAENCRNAITDDTGALLPMARDDAICNYVVAGDETLVVFDIDARPTLC